MAISRLVIAASAGARVAEPAQFLLQGPQLRGFGPALLAAGQVSVRAVAFGSVQLAVDQG